MDDWIYWHHIHTPLRTTINYSAIADTHTHARARTHAHTLSLCSQPSLVVSWQRILTSNYTSLLVTAEHLKPTLHSPIPFLSFLLNHLRLPSPSILIVAKSKSLYDWWYTATKFILASSPLRITTTDYFQLNPCGNSPYVTSSPTRRWVCLLWICLAFR
jgi:hypothetical protein